ncbi:filament-like plant protein 4 [Dendrobium catenatum]|uniref:Filament-like plant protein 4 n=1 Tax=Dendrobium catenatum TaxID=906689 RepID=A0A2I0WC55_9ASPA|nr:filament-like plant protein 4 [Dendrobium catenatum]PKU73233.1 Filament-like plant protein 4 [Dendrobium catenatum]
MDRRSWPWKKKASDKTAVSTDTVVASFPNSNGHQKEKDDAKNEKFLQITMESYTHLTGLEDQVKALNEKLISAQSEMSAKDDLVKQHAKVAEEAVSGWEKAENEALVLKQQLESVTSLKIAAEERALHLDGALKECMKQIRNVKEESEQKLHDVVFTNTKQWEKVKAECDVKITAFEQELQNALAENSALSRSLQERSSLLMQVSEEKSQAEAQIEVLNNDILSCEREINSLKYEFHVITKELEIRNEEKNMSMRSTEVATKQHLEDVKKITKLEAECQRLRGLVRKKLPGPAALAQMKLEVENLGRENGENRLRRSPVNSSSPYHISPSEYALESVQQVHKDNEFLTARLLAMEEEMKMLKEALSKRNNELQASRNLCAKQANKLRSYETHMLVLNQQKATSKPPIDCHFENGSNSPGLTSISEDVFDENGSYSGSLSTALISEFSHLKKEKSIDKAHVGGNSNHLELMDDFLEMERLACLSTKNGGDSNMANGFKTKNAEPISLVYSKNEGDGKEQKCGDPELLMNLPTEHASNENQLPHLKLKSRITCIFESQAHDSTMKNIIENIMYVIQDAQEELLKEENLSTANLTEQKYCHNDILKITADGPSLNQVVNSCSKVKHVVDQQLKDAISHIHEFFLSLVKDAAETQNSSDEFVGIGKKIDELSASVDRIMCTEVCLYDFIVALSHVLCEAIDLGYKIRIVKENEGESNNSDCIDKETLLENNVTQHGPMKESPSRSSSVVPDSSFSAEFEGSIGVGFEIKTTTPSLSQVNFERLKLEKEKMEVDFANCKEMLSQTSFTLVETEKQLSELKSELASCQKSNSFAETQLKCMVESYKILESQKEELGAELDLLHAKAETLNNELQEEKHCHQEDIAKYEELKEQIERNMKWSTCSLPSSVDNSKTQQEIDIAAAAEKLAECQDTIFLLSKQLQSMRSPAEPMDSSPNRRPRLGDVMKDEKDAGTLNTQGLLYGLQLSDQGDQTLQTGGESPLNPYNSRMSQSDSEPSPFTKSPISTKHQSNKSHRSSSSSSAGEKLGRGFSRFFSRDKNEQ